MISQGEELKASQFTRPSLPTGLEKIKLGKPLETTKSAQGIGRGE
jgi:hypothetical protein